MAWQALRGRLLPLLLQDNLDRGVSCRSIRFSAVSEPFES
jgi:hypothetical protein